MRNVILKFVTLASIPAFLAVLGGCSKKSSPTAPTENSTTTAYVYMDSTRQVISGFGGANLPQWIGDLTTQQTQEAFGDGPGQIGLTLLRERVPYDSTYFYLEVPTAKLAESMGAKVFATPWTPPAWMKSNDNIVGGILDTSKYSAYAGHLKSFADYMASQGAPLYAISIQNEPDASVNYESCSWNATQMLNFMKYYAPEIGIKIIMPESEDFNHALSNPTLDDPVAASHVAIIGGHIYGGGIDPYPLAMSEGKLVWMTEHLDTNTTWSHVLGTAREISACMKADMDAYVWWYIRRFYGLISENSQVTKRGYVMSQFARFIRPGYYRVSATSSPYSNLDITAYKNGSKVVIVAVNSGSSFVNQTFSVVNGSVNSMTPYVTSADKNCQQGKSIAVTDGTFRTTLDASSVTTFVSN